MKPTRHNLRYLRVVGGLLALQGLGPICVWAQQPAPLPAPRTLPKNTPAAKKINQEVKEDTNPRTSLEAVDAETGIVHSQKLASGVPLGGIGTGTFQLLTDGTVAQAAIANNWNHPLQSAQGCFAAIWTRTQTRTDGPRTGAQQRL